MSVRSEQPRRLEAITDDHGGVPTAGAADPGRHRDWRSGGRLVLVLVLVFVLGAGLATGLAWFFTRSTGPAISDAARAEASIGAGISAQNRGDLTAAAADYAAAIRIEPSNTQALYDLGVVDDAQANDGLAEAQYRKVLAINGRYEPALYNLAIIDEHRGNQSEALALYQRAVQAAPGDPRAHFNLALMLRAMPKYRTDGDAQMRIALRLDPSLSDPAAKK